MRAAAAKPSQNSANTMSVCGSNASGCACWNSFSAATRGNLRPHATQLIPSAQPLRWMLSQVHPYRGENIRSSVSAWIHPVILIVQLTPSSSVRIPSPSSVVSAPLSGNNPETTLCLLALGIRLVAPIEENRRRGGAISAGYTAQAINTREVHSKRWQRKQVRT
jgi:hypothetical protein